MKQTHRKSFHLVLGISGISGLAWFAHTYPPENIRNIIIFFIILFATCFLLAYFLLNNVRRSLLITFSLVGILLLRGLELREPVYMILLFFSLISMNFLIRRK